ncbi:DUF4199 domain-containing protein [Seonamhaeicola maritimus]|uniref:DUF4199 domain-containing protein n=1 Tax=Seonamhaeicola maritimus TaxID=2591822 RepID=A0A5C7GEW3_9FLAO|nr:DUF4199 domain-containing protein [Seonamhaeicola maritimus]TXG35257.1 DUF4199 domain-containing protein [Seonamhaeicola maritimus]
MEKSFKSIAKDYGLYLGTILTLVTVAAYAINLDLFVNTWFGISIYIIGIALGILAIVKAKKHLNGYISFKESFTAYFISIVIGLSIVTLVSFIIFNFIDTEAAVILKEKSLDKIVQVYKNMNQSEEKIAELVEKMESENLFSLKNSAISLLINYLLPLSIIGLLVAAAMKKSKPETE